MTAVSAIAVHSPFSGELVGTAPVASQAQVIEALDAGAVDVFRFAAIEALRDDGEAFAGDVSPNGRARRAHTLRLPVGLVAAITPFNHPLNH